MEDILYKSEVYKIVGLCMEVHNYLGHGFLEIVYKDALEIELRDNLIMYEREKEFTINYKRHILNRKFYSDFYVMDKIILEVKSTREGLSNEYVTQTLNYLKASGCQLGLIVNFGKSSLEYKRLIF
ncbi:MAG: GxxExxY protein [Ginsengibacter sp.]